MNNAILKIIYGDAQIREYATITTAAGINESVYLAVNNTRIEVSKNQWLLSLDPMVFGIWLENGKSPLPAEWIRDSILYFTEAAAGNKPTSGNVIAEIALSFLNSIDDVHGKLILLQVVNATIHHVNKFRTRLLFSKFYKTPKLNFRQFKAVVSAFSYPRRVRIVCFKQGDYYNIFPMDFIGEIQGGNYVFGLRHTNASLAKIIEEKKIVVAEVAYIYKDIIYQLGAHHGSAPPLIEKLPFKVISSKNFGFYIPEWVDSYKEINITKTQNLGSHMLLWGKVFDTCILKEPAGPMYHIHYLLYLYQQQKGYIYPMI